MCICWIVTSIILAGKRDSRRHRVTTGISENVVVTEQVIKYLKFYHFAIGISLIKLIHFLFIYSDIEKIKAYIDSFRYGAPPHGGGGIGEFFLLF